MLSLKVMQINNTPGPDGFTVELSSLSIILNKIPLNKSLDHGSMPLTLTQAVISLLSKKRTLCFVTLTNLINTLRFWLNY